MIPSEILTSNIDMKVSIRLGPTPASYPEKDRACKAIINQRTAKSCCRVIRIKDPAPLLAGRLETPLPSSPLAGYSLHKFVHICVLDLHSV